MPHWIGNRIRLREYRMDDLKHIRKWVNDGEVTAGLHDMFLRPHAEKTTEAFIQDMMSSNPNLQAYIIADRETEAYIGQIDMSVDWKNRTGTIGISIGVKDQQGKGIGEEAIRLLMAVAYEQLGLHRIQLDVYSYNERAYRCYKRCGFIEEGRMRERLYRNGQRHDIVSMGILKREYDQDAKNDPYKQAVKWQGPEQG
ncbi:GNAT family N-acetyltransferase [Paenibacillus marinisediminis]